MNSNKRYSIQFNSSNRQIEVLTFAYVALDRVTLEQGGEDAFIGNTFTFFFQAQSEVNNVT